MRGMVIIDSSHFGKSMEIVKCIKEKIHELSEALNYAEMEESRYRHDDSEYEERETRRTPRGRYNY